MNYFVKGNPDLCIGCRTCMIGCVVAHEGKRIFEIDPDSYTFNPKLHMVKTAKLSIPVQCKHCENPACMAVCTAGAISQKDHGVMIDINKCMGCKSCMDACPFGAITIPLPCCVIVVSYSSGSLIVTVPAFVYVATVFQSAPKLLFFMFT